MADQVGERLAGLVAKRYDAFISYAFEDKASFAAPIAKRLKGYGARVWFDDFELRLGDSLVQKIDEGLAQSARGVLVISPAFLGKRWTEYERQGLTARDVESGGGVLIPVWHGVTAAEVAVFSPTLAQRFALVTKGMDVGEIALRLLDEIRPDLAEGPFRRAAFEKMVVDTTGETVLTSIDSLRPPEKPLHQDLPADLLTRIRLIHGALYEVLPLSFEDTVVNFKSDLYPDREVEHWESIAANYLMVIRDYGVDGPEARKEVFGLILGGSSMQDLERLPTAHISPELVATIKRAYREVRRRRFLPTDPQLNTDEMEGH